MRNYYKPGTHNAICMVCGFKFKADMLMKRWDGVRVCEEDFEVRHPQDLIRGVADNGSVPWSLPEPDVMYIDDIVSDEAQAL